MASGDTLSIFTPFMNEPPSSNLATFDLRNGHPVLDFDDTTGESAIFTSIMPQNYANATGVTVYVMWAATSATTGTIGWTVEFERMEDGADITSDSFASAQTITAATVPGTAGLLDYTSVAITKGANMDSVVAGDMFRIRITRDVGNDTATGDAELFGVEIRET